MIIHLIKSKTILKILSVTGAFLLIIILLIMLVIKPLIRKKIETTLAEYDRNLKIEIGKIHLLLIETGIKLENVTLSSNQEHIWDLELNGETGLLKFKGINIIKALFRKDTGIREVIVSRSRVNVKFPRPHDSIPLIVLPLNINIGRIIVDNTDIVIKNRSNSLSFSVKEGVLKVYNLEVNKFDTIKLMNGNIKYTEHAEFANEAGSISFKKINARIYKISNDDIYKSENDSLKLICKALLMGKGKLTIILKARIFGNHNTFLVNGSLSGMDADELNPILERNAYIFASGKIDPMNFNFIANNLNSTGKMTLLYHGLNIAVKNKRTDDTTVFKERFISLIANKRLENSNPGSDKEIRDGVISFERDPERFLINYCFKSVMSGIKSGIVNNTKKWN